MPVVGYDDGMSTLPGPAPGAMTLPALLHALGDPVRLELVRRTSADAEMTCSADGLDVPKSTLSNHWRILREAGLITVTIDGRRRRIRLRSADIESRFPGLLNTVLRAADAEKAAAALPSQR